MADLDIVTLIVAAVAAIIFFIGYYERVIKRYSRILEGAQGVINGRYIRSFFEVLRLEGEYQGRKVILGVNCNYAPIVRIKPGKLPGNFKKVSKAGFVEPAYVLSRDILRDKDNFITILEALCEMCEKIEQQKAS